MQGGTVPAIVKCTTLCPYHEGYADGYEAARRDQHARTIRGMDVNATASPPSGPLHFASEEPQGRPGR